MLAPPATPARFWLAGTHSEFAHEIQEEMPKNASSIILIGRSRRGRKKGRTPATFQDLTANCFISQLSLIFRVLLVIPQSASCLFRDETVPVGLLKRSSADATRSKLKPSGLAKACFDSSEV